ncbi:ACP S-malonyltransferase [Hansschlegelia sp. KR7-227]|uniref:ACP S-malonyltransferase n=1 Tax=Hansschlegelia sp. KR7-227 TaxID=3400914 RepID=UPI003C0310DE
MTLAILCAGQGAQHPDMFERLAAEEAARPTLAEISLRTGLDVMSGRIAAPPEALTENRVAQLLVVGHAVATFAALSANGIEASVCAGYSAGEIAAHACAGAFPEGRALAVVARRAACMDAACAGRPRQGMVAAIGLSVADAERLADETGVFVAIVNGPDHVVIGGAADDVERFAVEAELRARHVRRLGVRVASHTPLLAAAGPPFAEAIRASGWRPPVATVLAGIDGRALRSVEDAAHYLSIQLHDRLDWARCLASVLEYGATATLEIGSGRALTRMVEEAYPDVPARAFEDFRSAAGAAAWARRHA